DGAAARICRAAQPDEPGRLRHRGPAGVRAGEMVASPVPQSAGPADQGGAAVPSEHRGHERAVPSESLTAMTLRLRRMDVVTMFAAVAVIAAVSAALRLW